MCSLKLVIRITGKKNQEFARFVIQEKNTRQKGTTFAVVGLWDLRQNRNQRQISMNILKICNLVFTGALVSKTALKPFYNFLAVLGYPLMHQTEFTQSQSDATHLRQILNEEITKIQSRENTTYKMKYKT